MVQVVSSCRTVRLQTKNDTNHHKSHHCKWESCCEILASVPWVPLQPGKGKLKIDEAKLWSEYFDVSCKLFRIFPRCCEKELIVFVLRLSLTWWLLTAPDIRDMQKTVISSHCLSHHHETARNWDQRHSGSCSDLVLVRPCQQTRLAWLAASCGGRKLGGDGTVLSDLNTENHPALIIWPTGFWLTLPTFCLSFFREF